MLSRPWNSVSPSNCTTPYFLARCKSPTTYLENLVVEMLTWYWQTQVMNYACLTLPEICCKGWTNLETKCRQCDCHPRCQSSRTWGRGPRWPESVFVTAAEFLNITEITGIANLTLRFSIKKFLLMSTIIFLHTSVK